MIWLHAPDWTRHVIASLVSRRAISSPSLFSATAACWWCISRCKYGSTRSRPIPTAAWPAQDLYSFYTPSREGGLGIADIDGDGLPDILCGNDWIRSPRTFDLHWRLFAINTWNELENSAMLRLANRNGILVAGRER